MALELKDVLSERNVRIDVHARDKQDALKQMCAVLEENGLVKSADAFYEDVLLREKLGPTCIGSGIAIPHGKSAAAHMPSVVVFQLDAPIEWESHMGMEDVTVVILFCVLDDNEAAREHLRLLSEVARKLAHDEARDGLKNAKTPSEGVAALS